MSIIDKIYKNWNIIVDKFDELCVHTIFNTKVLVISLGSRHGTRCSGCINIITIDGKHIIHYPSKNIVDNFEFVRTKIRLLNDLLISLRLEGTKASYKMKILPEVWKTIYNINGIDCESLDEFIPEPNFRYVDDIHCGDN